VEFIIENWPAILLACVSGGMLAWPMLRGAGQSGSVSAPEAVRLINREKGVVIDVCEPQEYAAAHISGSRSVPLGSLSEAKNLPTNKALPLVIVCASGARARRAAPVLKKLGYDNVHVLGGGLAGWREAGLPVEAGSTR